MTDAVMPSKFITGTPFKTDFLDKIMLKYQTDESKMKTLIGSGPGVNL